MLLSLGDAVEPESHSLRVRSVAVSELDETELFGAAVPSEQTCLPVRLLLPVLLGLSASLDLVEPYSLKRQMQDPVLFAHSGFSLASL